jgi:hypothetical protein
MSARLSELNRQTRLMPTAALAKALTDLDQNIGDLLDFGLIHCVA